jgi:SAM-dependent methyltransferase
MDRKTITQKNREAWNEAMPYHQKGRKLDLKEEFKKKTFSQLHSVEIEAFKSIRIKDKRVIHVCCNNGIELISIYRLGARECIGVDISDKAIEEARQFASIAEANCHFIQSDVYELQPDTLGTFDVVYISVGALCWLPNLPRFFKIVGALICSGGHVVIFESHPFTNVLAFDGEEGFNPKFPRNAVYSYFRKDPFIFTDGIDYIGGTTYESKPHVNFSFTLADIFDGLLSNDIQIQKFQEFPFDIALSFPEEEKNKIMPLSMLVIGKKN